MGSTSAARLPPFFFGGVGVVGKGLSVFGHMSTTWDIHQVIELCVLPHPLPMTTQENEYHCTC